MREKFALAVCALALALVVGLSFLFAVRHNPETAAAPLDSAKPPAARASPDPVPAPVNPEFERGRTVYGQQGCATCHAIAGQGNPRHPLDGTGARRTAEELPHWILGTGEAADELAPAVRRRKERYQTLPPEDLRALVSYLASLQAAKE